MKVLVIHNRYRSASPSGENAVVDAATAALRARCHDVATYLRDSDEIDEFGARERWGLAVRPLRSADDLRAVADLVREYRPDVVHVHNLYPLISTAVLAPARAGGAAVVHTVHNLRHRCLRGTQVLDGQACTRCVDGGHPGPGIVHGCYRDSRPASVVMAAALLAERHRLRAIDRWIALTPRMAAHIAGLGVPEERIGVVPNTIADPGDPGDPAPPGEGLLFAGRMSPEKGVRLLLQAWCRRPDGTRGRLTLLGDGEDLPYARRIAAGRTDVVVAGRVDAAAVRTAMRAARAVVVPSVWEEPFPLVLVEALAAGRPVLACRSGGLPDLVGEAGWICEPTVAGLDAGIDDATGAGQADPGSAARRRYEQHFHPDVVWPRLVAEYEQAVETRRSRQE